MHLVVDPDLCTGCLLCAQVCSLNKTGTCNPARARLRIVDWESTGETVPMVCHDCAEPVCVPCCPEGAINKDSVTGMVTIDTESCTNCRLCLEICPYGAPFMDPVDRQVYLCDHCDGQPACVAVCPTGALVYCEPDGASGEVRQRGLGAARRSLIRSGGA
jgi:Fe-S-cluster-containing dehydrogenase component